MDVCTVPQTKTHERGSAILKMSKLDSGTVLTAPHCGVRRTSGCPLADAERLQESPDWSHCRNRKWGQGVATESVVGGGRRRRECRHMHVLPQQFYTHTQQGKSPTHTYTAALSNPIRTLVRLAQVNTHWSTYSWMAGWMGRAIPVFPCSKVLRGQRASASEDCAPRFPLPILALAQFAARTVSQPRLWKEKKTSCHPWTRSGKTWSLGGGRRAFPRPPSRPRLRARSRGRLPPARAPTVRLLLRRADAFV